jgi:ATP-dependent helicase HrpB
LLAAGLGAMLPDSAREMFGQEWLSCVMCKPHQVEASVAVAIAIPETLLLEEYRHRLELTEELSWDNTKKSVRCEKVIKMAGLEFQRTALSLPKDGRVGKVLLQLVRREGLKVLPFGSAQTFMKRYQLLRKFEPSLLELSETYLMDHLEVWLGPALERCQKLVELSENEVLGGLQNLLDWAVLQKLDKDFPSVLQVPSGSKLKLNYDNGEFPVLEVRIQEIFGWKKTPLMGGGRCPLTLSLLSPAYRPVQTTSDLESFWKNAYPEVCRELKRKYPRHSWPEDPLVAEPVKGPLKRKI